MKISVGYTGFVGSNLDVSTTFDGRYNSKNISAKYLANSAPAKDFEVILNAQKNIKKFCPKSWF